MPPRLFAVALLVLASCRISRPIAEQHPSVQRAIASEDDSEAGHEATVLRTAAGDLACPAVEVVLRLERRYANTAVPRYVVEGCGKRALYVETCEDYPRCRYLVVSVVPLAPPVSQP